MEQSTSDRKWAFGPKWLATEANQVQRRSEIQPFDPPTSLKILTRREGSSQLPLRPGHPVRAALAILTRSLDMVRPRVSLFASLPAGASRAAPLPLTTNYRLSYRRTRERAQGGRRDCRGDPGILSESGRVKFETIPGCFRHRRLRSNARLRFNRAMPNQVSPALKNRSGFCG